MSNFDRDVAMDLIPRRRAARHAARFALSALLLLALSLRLIPWQQSIGAGGRVVAYAPLERQQDIKAPVGGRVVQWFVQEGETVKTGQPLALVEDNDPTYVERITRKRDAALDRLETARRAVKVYEDQRLSLESARLAAIDGAEQRVRMAVDRAIAAEQARDAALAGKAATDLNLERQRALEKDGLSSTRNLELAELAAATADADVARAEATLRAAKSEVSAHRAERTRTAASMLADIDRARASAESSRADVASYENNVEDQELVVGRQGMMQITAPRDGTVLRQIAHAGGEFVKQGDAIAQFVPDTEARAVELWVSGRDAPLIAPGRAVRLQFEGWPAVQFVGWPSVAVGTFGGRVAFVDSAADATGRTRVVVSPDPEEPRWPSTAFLRQGTRTNGWVLLDRVSLGFELWRQWNGFPPATTPPTTAPPTGPSAPATAKAKG